MSTAKHVIHRCAVCAHARSANKKLEPPTGNIPEFRVPKPFGDECNRPYRVCYYDFKGPIRVSDDRISKNTTAANPQAEEPQDQIKIYILSVTCAMTRHTTFEVTIDRSYENTKLAMLRVFYERGISRLLISDQEPAFKSIKKDFSETETKETLDWLKGWKDSDQRKDLEQSYGTQFRFQHPESPEHMGLVERLHKTITSSMLSLKQANLKLSQITTLVKGLQCMMNKRPLSGMEKEQIDEVEFVTPNMLLTGWDLNMCPNYTVPNVPKHLIQARADIVHFTRHMKSVYQRVWQKFISTYVDSLNLYKKKNQESSIIKQGDLVIYSALNKEMSPVNVFQVCQVLEAIKGRDGEIRSLRVKRIKGGQIKEFTRDIRRFALLEISTNSIKMAQNIT